MKKSTYMIGGVLVVGVVAAVMLGCGGRMFGRTAAASTANVTSTSATVLGDIQNVTTKIGRNSYSPITVTAGVPVKWTIQADAKTLNGCNNKIIIPEYNIEKKLKSGDNVIEFTPDKSGVVPYSCWMGMIQSEINVVDGDANNTVVNIFSAQAVPLAATTNDSNATDFQKSTVTEDKDGTIIEAKIAVGGYPVIVVEAGKPVRINFKADENTLNSCNNEIIIPEFNNDQPLQAGDNIVTINPTKTGEFDYSCWMGMVQSKIIVVEAGTAQIGALPMDASANTAKSCPMMGGSNVGGGGCCGGR